MFRITTNHVRGRLELIVDGSLCTECAALIERYCKQALADGARVIVSLRDVQVVDLFGQDLISRLQHSGISVRGADLYTSYVVDQCRKRAHNP
ncbi:MAG: hypothetical protein HY010_23650 [Acidobacteria bacterium]|nr:hypothetical protein [Acidobacteriota bacterium]